MKPTKSTSDNRARHRRTAYECSALIDMLLELNPPTALPPIDASDRVLGAWIGKRELIQNLVQLREEAASGTDGLPKLLGG